VSGRAVLDIAAESDRELDWDTIAERYDVLPADERVVERFAALVVALRRAGRRTGALDALIAATAMAEAVPVMTQDEDFALLAAHADGALRVVVV